MIRDKEGEKTFETIEAIRQAAVKFHRDGEQSSATKLDRLLKGLDTDQSIAVARAFSYFKHLVNIAEDLDSHQRSHGTKQLPSPGSLPTRSPTSSAKI